jgi:hypothetical protein
MATRTYAEFDTAAIDAALKAAQQHNTHMGVTAFDHTMDLSMGGEMSISAQCISVTTQNHAICIDLPFKLGKKCLPIPFSFPDGTAAQACLSICTTWGIPTGVKVTVSIAGHVVLTKSFGKC